MNKWLLVMCLALSACVAQSGASPSAASSPANAAGDEASASAEPEMVCKRERPTGSSISKRVCRPKDDPNTENDAQRAAGDIQRGSLQGVRND